MKKHLRLAIFALIVGAWLLPIPTYAQLDTRCFLQNDCLQVRKDMGVSAQSAAEGFYQGPDSISACKGTEKINPVTKQSEKVGFCLPAGETETKITFGNKKNFLHLGDFIQFIYGYGIIIASILAVVMIILGGIQYMASGSMLSSGKKDQVNGAKKRIAGGVIGLTIALLSYTILSTINPQLIAFRLPQIWMINTIADPVEYCTELKNDELVAPLGTAVERTEDLPKETRKEALASLYERANFTQAPKEAKCGNEFFIQKGNGFTCTGIACPREGEACFTPPQKGDAIPKSYCKQTNLTGTIQASKRLMCGDLKDEIIDNNLKLIAICKNGDLEEIADLNIEAGQNTYDFGKRPLINTVCTSDSDDGGLVGFYLGAEINDEGGGFFGGMCPGNPGSGGYDDWHAIGTTGPGSTKCTVNLGKLGFQLLNGREANCKDPKKGIFECTCGAISADASLRKLSKMTEFTDHLLTLEDLKNGKTCNIFISRDELPDIENPLGDRRADSCWKNQRITDWSEDEDDD
jgi:hypothetical protein